MIEIKPFDPYCQRSPSQIPGIVAMAHEEGWSADEYVRREEGTYNRATGHFACDECYIALGQPASPAGWVAP